MIRSRSPIEVQKNPLHNVLGKAKFLSKAWFWWLIRGMMRSLEVSKTAKNSSQNVCLGSFVCGCCWLVFHEKIPWLLGTPKNYNSPLKLRGESYKGGLWFFVRLLKQSLGKMDLCCVHVFMFCQVEGFMSPNVNMNLSSHGIQMWFWVRVIWRLWEEERRPVGSKERYHSNLTP